MKLRTIITALTLLAVPVANAAPKAKAPKTLPGGWVYEWGDEFNGTKLDEKKWAYEHRGCSKPRCFADLYQRLC